MRLCERFACGIVKICPAYQRWRERLGAGAPNLRATCNVRNESMDFPTTRCCVVGEVTLEKVADVWGVRGLSEQERKGEPSPHQVLFRDILRSVYFLCI